MPLATSRLGVAEWRTTSLTINVGAAFTPLTDQACDEVLILNPAAGVSLDIQSQNNPAAGATEFVTIDPSSGLAIEPANNAKEIGVRRTDLAATATTVRYIWRKWRK